MTGFTNAAFNSATAGKIRQKLTRTDLLGQIEEAGWRLEHANWVYIQTGQNSRDKFLASGQHVVVTGEVLGIYLFRRDDARAKRATPPTIPAGSRETTPQPIAPKVAPAKRTVSCPHCDAEQRIPAAAERFTCGGCKEISAAPI